MYNGIAIEYSLNVTVEYFYSQSSYNSVGILISHSNYITILHALIDSNIYGIRLEENRNVVLVNISIANLQTNGMEVVVNYGVIVNGCETVRISNLSVTQFQRIGLFFNYCYSTITLEHSNFSNHYPTTTKKTHT